MQFARPEWLWLLAAIPGLGIRAVMAGLRRSRDWKALGRGGRPSRDGAIRAMLALVCLILALAQPRWGRGERPPLPAGHDVVILVDVSRSMGVTDAVPDRLAVAKGAAEGLILRLGASGGERVALVAFAGRGVARCPLTENLGAVLDALHALRPGAIEPGGSDLGAALDAALDAFDEQDRDGGRAVVLFSDGEDLQGAWAPAVARLHARGVVVHAVAIGDDEAGHPIPSNRPGDAGPVRYQGRVVLSKRDDRVLKAIARGTDGAFVPLGLAQADLGRLYATRIAPAEMAHRRAVLIPEPRERASIFLGWALALGLASFWSARTRPASGRRWAFGLGMIGLLAIGANSPEPASMAIDAGRKAFAAGDFDVALERFRGALALSPGNAIAHYDVASTLYQLGRYDEARGAYVRARELAPADLRPKIDYALGNTSVRLGRLEAAIRHYDDCLALASVVHDDAAANRRYAEEQTRRSVGAQGGAEPGKDEPRPQDQPRPGPLDPKTPRGSDKGSAGGGNGSTQASRGQGGAGGRGSTPPAGSPEEQLTLAMENVREARAQRLDAASDEADVRDDRKDW